MFTAAIKASLLKQAYKVIFLAAGTIFNTVEYDEGLEKL